MEQVSKNIADIYRAVTDEIIELRFSMATDNVLGQNQEFLISRWKSYVDYYERIKATFQNTLIAKNKFLREKDLNHFYKKYLDLFDKSVDYSIHLKQDEALDPLFNLTAKWQDNSSVIQDKIKDNQLDNEQVKALLEEQQVKCHEFNNEYGQLYKNGKEIVKQNVFRFFHYHFDRFWEIFKKCESPLEQAIFIGLFSYETFYYVDWTEKNKFDNQVKVGNYRLDFALMDNDIKLDIEVDGHTFHEKTEDQAVNDRVRDRALQKGGWDVLRFHRKEVELDLQSCVDQIKNFYEMKRLHLNRGK